MVQQVFSSYFVGKQCIKLFSCGLAAVRSHEWVSVGCIRGATGASLGERRFHGGEPSPLGSRLKPYPPPSEDMLRALEYIQNLRDQTPVSHPVTLDDSQPSSPGDDSLDMKSFRSELEMARSAKSPRDDDERGEGGEDHTQQWLQAVLSTLQQTEEESTPPKNAPQKTPLRGSPHSSYNTRPLHNLSPAITANQDTVKGYGRSKWAEPDGRRHRKYPLMFEDDEEGQPFKRTNENAEEQYTPQKLATLQSVFEELSRISTSKDSNKQKRPSDDDDDDDDDDDNNGADDEEDDDGDGTAYRVRKTAFDDLLGREEEWLPLEEQIETEEEERERHEFNRGSDDEDDDEEEREENEEDDDNEGKINDAEDVKRSSQLGALPSERGEEPNDITRLVDYYLLKVLEQNEQKQRRDEMEEREQEEEEEKEREIKDDEEDQFEEEERDTNKQLANAKYSVDPQSFYQVLQLAQKLQIPPEELLELLQSEEPKDSDKILSSSQAQTQTPLITHSSSPKTHLSSPSYSNRQLLETPLNSGATGSFTTQDILNLLGLPDTEIQSPKYLQTPKQHQIPKYSMPSRPQTENAYPELDGERYDKRESDYDDTVGEDELASYLATQMLTQKPQRDAQPQSSSRDEEEEEEQLLLGTLEHAVQDYLDETNKKNKEKRQRENRESATGLDDDTLLRILNFLELGDEDIADRDVNGKIIPGM
ncbi:secretogranin-2a [Chanos chanos]|uniref:Secretogranin-2a n=1 Tax=Chanos chanos TaxID=29144 RepID=A0A6J2VNB2_CHACN|nr:secretogranin-2 [Chanos chanos]